MIFIIGGTYQGKLDFAVSLWKSLYLEEPCICSDFCFGQKTDIVPNLHLFIKKRLEELIQMEQESLDQKNSKERLPSDVFYARILLEEILSLRVKYPNIIFTMAELGCGVVPICAKDRIYREICGRISCVLAMLAEKAYQITCGLASLLAEHDILTITFLRHGKTKGNEEKRYVGRTDETLSEHGRKEILQLVSSYRTFLKPDMIFSSPMKRCQETSKLLFPKQAPILLDHLCETDFGQFEGKNCDELNQSTLAPLWQKWIDSNGTLPFPEGESYKQFSKRTTDCFTKTITKLCHTSASCKIPVGSIIFFLHGGSIMALLDAFVPKDYFHRYDSFYSWKVKNGDGFLLLLDKKEWLSGKRMVYPIGQLKNFI